MVHTGEHGVMVGGWDVTVVCGGRVQLGGEKVEAGRKL